MAHVVKAYPRGAVLLVVVAAGCQIPNAAERAQIEAHHARWRPNVLAMANVSEGTDVWSIATRAIMTTLSLIHRHDLPYKVFSQVEAATLWVGRFLAPVPDDPETPAQGLARAIDELRSAVLR